MTMTEKPSLEDAYLEHFGVRGMKWGIRRKRRDEEERKKIFSPKAKKVAIGAALIIGAAATAIAIKKYGGAKIPTTNVVSKVASAKTPIPDPPFQWPRRISAGDLAHQRVMSLHTLKQNELRNAAAMDQVNKLLKKPTMIPQFEFRPKTPSRVGSLVERLGSRRLDEGMETPEILRRNLADPNYVWKL